MRSFVALVGLLLALPVLAQQPPVPTAPNQRSAAGQRVGNWVLTYTQRWKETTLPDSIAYYRLITFDKAGKPTGLTRAFYRSGAKQFEGYLTQLEPDELAEGVCTWYHENGQRSKVATLRNGKEQDTTRTWYADGKPEYVLPKKEGLLEGLVQVWNESGQERRLWFEQDEYIDTDTLHSQVFELYQRGKYAEGIRIMLRRQKIQTQTIGKEHPDYATTLHNLAFLHRSMSQYEKALPLYQEAAAIRAKVLSKEHPDYATSMHTLAELYQLMGQYEKALPLYQEAVAIRAKVLGKEHPDYATSLNNLADLYQLMGQYEKALPLFLETVVIKAKALGKEHPDYATSLNNLADLYQLMGQYEKALPLFLETVVIKAKALGKEHTSYATTLNNLAGLYKSMGQYEKALPLYQEAIAIRAKVLGKEHPDYAIYLDNLANLYLAMGQDEKALPLCEEAVAIQAKVLGKEHPWYAISLQTLAYQYQVMGQYEKALLLYQETVAIQAKVLGKEHPDYASTLNNLAELYQLMGQYEKALPLVIAARRQYKTQLLSTVGILNESALARFQETVGDSDFAYSLGYVSRASGLFGQHYNDALLSKGVGLLATQQLNNLLAQTTDTTTRRLAGQLRQTKQRVNRLLTLPAVQQRGLDSLERAANEQEQQLVLRLPEYGRAFEALRVEWPQVQTRLKPDEAAIEFIQFRYYHKIWTDSTLYAALVLRPGWPSPRMVFLGEERQLDSLIATNGQERRAAYVERLYTASGRGGVVSGTLVKPRRSLYGLVWQPLDSLLSGVTRVYYSPSGLLHRLNLAALPIDAKRRLSDKYRLTLLASTRQLALKPVVRRSNRRALLLGDIRYDLDSVAYRVANARFRTATDGVASRGTFADGDGSAWQELDYTRPEVEAAGTLLRQAGYRTDTLLGLRASEEAFQHYTHQVGGSPQMVHLATHGFFYDVPDSRSVVNGEPEAAFVRAQNALVRSGLVLAGGNHVWQGRATPQGQEDGILTAYEISLLDLRDTELVVLSACETGLGDLRGSEGVYGLQRAFKMAGVQNLIMSLWQVPDNATKVLMERFYGYHLRDKQTIREAFDKAVADVKTQYTEPYFWAGFVLVE